MSKNVPRDNIEMHVQCFQVAIFPVFLVHVMFFYLQGSSIEVPRNPELFHLTEFNRLTRLSEAFEKINNLVEVKEELSM